MIHIITSENRHLYGPQLWAMHEERRRQCVEKNGWVDLVVLDGGEVDDYDDDRAIYLLGFDDEMRLEVGLRLRPTDDRCMLADKFPHLIAPGETPKKGPDVWEATRLFTTEVYRDRKGAGRGQRVFEVWAAAFEHALRHGVTRFVGMIDMQLVMKMFRCGFKSIGGIKVESVLDHSKGADGQQKSAPEKDVIELSKKVRHLITNKYIN